MKGWPWAVLWLACAGWAPTLHAEPTGGLAQWLGKSSAVNGPANGSLAQRPMFLPVEQAFKVSTRQESGQLVLSFTVTPGHYLYQQRFGLSPAAGVSVGTIEYSKTPVSVDDPDFGRVPVFDQSVELRVPVQGSGELVYRWQGCAKAGLCYPPQRGSVRIQGASAVVADPGSPVSAVLPQSDQPPPNRRSAYAAIGVPASALTVPSLITGLPRPAADVRIIPLPSPQVSIQSEDNDRAADAEAAASVEEVFNWPYPPVVPRAPNTAWPWTGPSPATMAAGGTSSSPDGVVDLDPFGLGDHPLTALLLLFLAGLGLAFTPCVLPMLPIVANLVARQHRRSPWHGFALSASYALGVASSYAALGALVAVFGHQLNVIGWLQQPGVLLAFAAVFVLLAAASFELIQLRLPAPLRVAIQRLGQHGQHERWAGSVLGSAVAGFLSALVVSPCVSAPLAGVLLSVSTVGSPVLGAAALFMLGLGLSTPLMLLGATDGRLLPKAGLWLDWIKQGFGLLLLGVALVLVGRVWQQGWMLLLWSALFFVLASWMASWVGRGRWLSRAAAAMLACWGAIVMLGASVGSRDPWHPLEALMAVPVQTQQPDAQGWREIREAPVIYRIEELEAMRQRHSRLLVDVTADWCISCRVMERELFGAQILPALQGWQRVRLDVTETNADSQKVLTTLGLFGPPALIFYENGQPVRQLVGEVNQEQLAATLAELN